MKNYVLVNILPFRSGMSTKKKQKRNKKPPQSSGRGLSYIAGLEELCISDRLSTTKPCQRVNETHRSTHQSLMGVSL